MFAKGIHFSSQTFGQAQLDGYLLKRIPPSLSAHMPGVATIIAAQVTSLQQARLAEIAREGRWGGDPVLRHWIWLGKGLQSRVRALASNTCIARGNVAKEKNRIKYQSVNILHTGKCFSVKKTHKFHFTIQRPPFLLKSHTDKGRLKKSSISRDLQSPHPCTQRHITPLPHTRKQGISHLPWLHLYLKCGRSW